MATSASAVKEAVKETVLGSDDAAGPSSQSKARFTKRAVKDETGELIMGPDEFINAVAPENEDFVSLSFAYPLPCPRDGGPDCARLLLRNGVACLHGTTEEESARTRRKQNGRE